MSPCPGHVHFKRDPKGRGTQKNGGLLSNGWWMGDSFEQRGSFWCLCKTFPRRQLSLLPCQGQSFLGRTERPIFHKIKGCWVKKVSKYPIFISLLLCIHIGPWRIQSNSIEVPGSKSQMQDQELEGRGVWVVGVLGPHLNSATSTWTEGKPPPLSYPPWVCLLICMKGWQAKEPHKGIASPMWKSLWKRMVNEKACWSQ